MKSEAASPPMCSHDILHAAIAQQYFLLIRTLSVYPLSGHRPLGQPRLQPSVREYKSFGEHERCTRREAMSILY